MDFLKVNVDILKNSIPLSPISQFSCLFIPFGGYFFLFCAIFAHFWPKKCKIRKNLKFKKGIYIYFRLSQIKCGHFERTNFQFSKLSKLSDFGIFDRFSPIFAKFWPQNEAKLSFFLPIILLLYHDHLSFNVRWYNCLLDT